MITSVRLAVGTDDRLCSAEFIDIVDYEIVGTGISGRYRVGKQFDDVNMKELKEEIKAHIIKELVDSNDASCDYDHLNLLGW